MRKSVPNLGLPFWNTPITANPISSLVLSPRKTVLAGVFGAWARAGRTPPAGLPRRRLHAHLPHRADAVRSAPMRDSREPRLLEACVGKAHLGCLRRRSRFAAPRIAANWGPLGNESTRYRSGYVPCGTISSPTVFCTTFHGTITGGRNHGTGPCLAGAGKERRVESG